MESLTSTIELLLFFSSSMAKGGNKEQFSIPISGNNFDFRKLIFSSPVPHASVSLSLFILPIPRKFENR